MNSNHHLPSPDCAACSPLLPLAAHDLLSEEKTRALHAHLAICAACRAELAIYDRAEAALHRAFALPQGGTPPFSKEDIMRNLISRTDSTAPLAPPAPAAAFPQRKRRFLANFSALAAALIIILLAAIIFRLPGSQPKLLGKSGTPIDLTHFILNSISMVSPNEGWAVGVTRLHQPSVSDNSPEYGDPVILHYWQGHWSPAPLPPNLKSRLGCGTHCPGIILRSLSMISATDGWAVGNTVLPPNADGVTVGIVLHYIGGQWVLDSFRDSALFSVFMRTASDGWIVGDGRSSGWSGSKGNAPAFHYNGNAWTPVNDPAFASVLPKTIVALSTTNVWLDGIDFSGSGFDGDDPEVILHYNGSHWIRERTDLVNSRLAGMAMISPTEGWAVGSLSGGTGPHPAHPEKALVERYIQGRWQQDTSFAGPPSSSYYSLYGIAMVSASEGWAVGSDGLIVHVLNGTWTLVHSPTSQTLWSIAMLSSTEGWAVGDQGAILHYAIGVWNLYQNT